MQKINSSLKYFYFEPSIKDDVFLQKSIITQRKDYFLDFTKKTLGVGKNLNNKPMSNNKNSNTMKKQRKVKKTDAEVWIGRFKKDSTNQLMAKMNSPHYSVLQKRIIGEIIEKRRNKVLPTEKLLLRFKKSSTQTISKTLKSERFTDLDKAIMKQILNIRKTKK